MLSYFMRLAVKLRMDCLGDNKNCGIKSLELMRLKIKLAKEISIVDVPKPEIIKPSSPIGCNLKHKFYIEKLGKGHLCKVYRRIRWADAAQTRKYKDWKIKVLQEEEPCSMDYLVVHKLPCKLS